jgi:hypothetical protein
MNGIFALLISLNTWALPSDTLRHDGYYLRVSDQAESWHLLYFRPDGTYMDSTSAGTPPVFERESLEAVQGEYRRSQHRKDNVILFSGGFDETPGTPQYKYRFDREDLLFTEWMDDRGKWQKTKLRYFFIPF